VKLKQKDWHLSPAVLITSVHETIPNFNYNALQS